jgi:hypothetical protein
LCAHCRRQFTKNVRIIYWDKSIIDIFILIVLSVKRNSGH